MKFCDKLANLRKANNLSQEQLAEKLDVSRQSVSKWESGDTYPDMSKMIQMCNILNCKLPDLMDDGTFGEDFKQQKEKINLSSYLHNFLEYVTKTYNMFIHMSFKSKMICLVEMLCVGLIITLIIAAFPELINYILDRVFRYVPYGYTISNILTDIFTAILVLLGVIVFFHLFKIRYLDYYVTITDNTIEKQEVEKPIEENKETSAFEEKPKKERVVIRDPKHSVSSFLDGLGRILSFIFRIFIIICALPALLVAVGGVYFAVIALMNISFSSIFIYIFISIICVAIIGFLLIYMAINYVFKRKQPFKVLIIIFIISLFGIGVGAGLATDKLLNFKIIENESYDFKDAITDEIIINEDEICEGMALQLHANPDNIEISIDENAKEITIIAEHPDYIDIYNDEYYEYEDDIRVTKGKYLYAVSSKDFIEIINDIKNDIKNEHFRYSYDDPSQLVRYKIITSQEILDSIIIEKWY